MAAPQAPREWRAAGLFTGRALGAAVDVVRDTHRAIGRRVGAFLPPGARHVQDLHLNAAVGVYATVSVAHRLVPQVVAAAAALGIDEAPSNTSVGRTLVPVLNGLKGDLVAADHPELAIAMALRRDDSDVAVSDIGTVYADATENVVVFVHGLAEDDRAWFLREPSQNYPERLAQEEHITPVVMRYNSGLRISDNGQLLAELLTELHRNWPVELRSLTLVGHSMGGLVIRSACEQGHQMAAPWVALTEAVITLGTPHTGAPLEQVVNVVDWVMRRVPEAEPIGRVLAERAIGVKDLRFGSLVPADWQGDDPDALLRNTRVDVPLMEHIRYHWIAGTLTRDPTHPIAWLVGDGMVRLPSATAVGKPRGKPRGGLRSADDDQRKVDSVTGAHIGATGHMKLLSSDEVYEQLKMWLQPQANQLQPQANHYA